MAVDNFVFLGGLDKSYNGRIRAHVLRRHHSQKQQRCQEGNATQSGRRTTSSPNTKSRLKKHTPNQHDLTRSRCQQTVAQTIQDKELITISARAPCSHSTHHDCPNLCGKVQDQPLLPSWSHFDTLSAAVSMRERYLIYHFVNSSKSLLYQTGYPKVLFFPPRDIAFRQLVHHKEGRTIMCTTAAYKIAFYTSGKAGPEALCLETQLMRLLQQRLVQSPPCIDDVSILLVIGFISRDTEEFAATMDETRGNVLQGHIKGLREIIVRRGGLPKLSSNPSISFHLHLYDLITAGEISVGLTPISQYFTTGLGMHPIDSPEPCDLKNKLACEFIGLYTSFHESFHRKEHQPHNVTAHLLRLCLYQTLPFSSPLLNLLSRRDNNPVLARLNVLIHLTDLLLTLHNTADKPSILSTFAQLGTFIHQQGLNRTPCLCVLSWVLMVRQAGFQLASPPRIWLASRMLWLAKRLDEKFVKQVEDMLFALLFPDASLFLGEQADVLPPERIWEPHEFADLLWQHLDRR